MLNKKFITGLATVILVFIGVFVFAQNRSEEDLLNDDVPPVIKLLGDTPINLEYGVTYKDAGATAKDDVDGDITSKIKKEGKVENTKLGTYTITYNVKDEAGNKAKEVKRIVNVVDTTKPTISPYGKLIVDVPLNGTYTDAGATAWDNVDGSLTSSIITKNGVDVNKLGTYYVTYNVKDKSDNAAITVTRTVNVVDVIAPVITILGNNPVNVSQGSTYVDAGATALDDVNGNITSNIVASSNVNTDSLGTYYVTYNVKDTTGNKAEEAVRVVKVVDNTPPVIKMEKSDEGVNIIIDVDKNNSNKYVELGAVLTDNVDPDTAVTNITYEKKDGVNYVSVAKIDTSVLGEYRVIYNGEDTQHLAATPAIRLVTVVDNSGPVINITPDSEENIDLIIQVDKNNAHKYVELGATLVDNLDPDTAVTNITYEIKNGDVYTPITVGDINTSIISEYRVTYNGSDVAGHIAAPVTRMVSVVDGTAPIINLKPLSDEEKDIVIQVNRNHPTTYVEPGAVLTDNLDADKEVTDIKYQLEVSEGVYADADSIDTSDIHEYIAIYNGKDTYYNAATQVTRKISVVDTEAPEITLSGLPVIYLEYNAPYVEPGFSATDNYDSSVTVVPSGTVTSNIAGKYVITYTATDSHSNPATKTRTVYVRPLITAPAPYNQEAGTTHILKTATLTLSPTNITQIAPDADTIGTTVGTVYPLAYSYTIALGGGENIPATPKSTNVTLVDTTAPVAQFNNYQYTTSGIGFGWTATASFKVDVTEASTLTVAKYMWTTSPLAPTNWSSASNFSNHQVISKQFYFYDYHSTYYLWVQVKDSYNGAVTYVSQAVHII